MASAKLREELDCRICLSLYTDPVSLRCGHNFCRSCIVSVLDAQEAAGGYSCPDCRAEYPERPALEESGQCNDLRCDYKTEDFPDEPDLLLEKRKCPIHRKPLTSYCIEDAVGFCASCGRSEDHQGHQVVTLEDASKNKQRLLDFLQEVTAQRSGRPIENLLETISKAHETAGYEEESVLDVLRDLRRQLEELEKRLHGEVLRRQEQEALVVAYRTHWQKMEVKLSRTVLSAEELCDMTDPLTFLQELHNQSRELHDTQKILEERAEEYERLQDLAPPHAPFISPHLSNRLSSVMRDLKKIQTKPPENCGQTDAKRSPRSDKKAPDSPSVQNVTSGNTKVFRLRLTSPGRHRCSETGIQFVVKGPVTLEYRLESWDNHMADTQRNGYEIAGPLFHIVTQEGPQNVSAVYLPHYLSPQCCTRYKSYIRCVHFKGNKMILESPALVRSSHLVLEHPTFSCLGALLEKFWCSSTAGWMSPSAFAFI
ncbi:uncharacterized protein [Engystomops pustulosus]|uniref:uncharacterized protein n=1 Tax=Engystomops pustulosus TaxID=76066 RepID=UPI003AFAB219